MRISVTERQLFKRCRRKWDFSSYNRQALTPVVNAPALNLGTLVHSVLADWTADPELDPTATYSTQAQAMMSSIIEQYKERIGCAPSEAELQPNMDAMMLGLGMISNYKDKWHTPLPPGFTLIENELTLVQDVPGAEHYECTQRGRDLVCTCTHCCNNATNEPTRYNPEPWDPTYCGCNWCIEQVCHQIECTFDGVMADEQGDLYIIERKTFGRTPTLEELNNNDQFLAYQWALTQQVGNVVGVAYDGLLKKLKPPAGKTKDDLFLRRILLRNKHELAEFGTLLALELNEMCNPNVPVYKSVPPVQGCQRWECSFMDVCHAMSRGEPTDSMLKMFVRSDRKKHLDVVED